MPSKSIKLLSIITMLILTVVLFSGCGKSGSRLPNNPPTIEITSFEGWDSTYVAAAYDTTITYTFQQRIYWNAKDVDGIIAGYAFRILDNAGNPVPTPGYDVIDDEGILTPAALLPYGKGWVIHYLEGADQTIPLSQPEAGRTIWSSQKYAVINFPSADINGNPITKYNRFEVVAIDDRGAITAEAAWRNFKTTSARPKCTLSTTKGNPNGKSVGSGMKLNFSMTDSDPFISPLPYKYEFQMMKTNADGSAIIPGSESPWYNTENQHKISEYLLTRYTDPPLTYDLNEVGAVVQQTRIVARVTDMAGVVSLPDTNSVMTFMVKPGYRPKTLIYPTKTYALGDYHYEDWNDDTTEEVLPNSMTSGSQRFATPFFKDTHGNFTAVYSPNLKVWIRWGWWGEYGNVTTGGTTIYSEDPYNKKVDVVLDRTTNENYFSEITFFHLRYDGKPYNFPPYAHSIATDENGNKWLRVPVLSPLGQSIVLTGLPVPPTTEPGVHRFEVRCEDLQGEVDPIGAVLEYHLHSYKDPASRNGILIIDDDEHSAQTSPDDLVNQKYLNMISDYNGPKVMIRHTFDTSAGDTRMDARRRHLAFSDLQNYKLVIYHSDNPSNTGNLMYDIDGLALYMIWGGNLVLSHTHKLSSILSEVSKNGVRSTFIRYLGLPDVPNLPYLSNSLANNAFLQIAKGQQTYPDLHLLEPSGDPNNPYTHFVSTVALRDGLSAVTYFPASTNDDVIYRLGCKPTDYPLYPPTPEQYAEFNDKIIGLRRISNNNAHSYLFGFPLSYMNDADTKAMMNKIISEVM